MSEYSFIETRSALLDYLAKASDSTGIWLTEQALKEFPKDTVRILAGDNGWESEPYYDYFNAKQLRDLATHLNKLADDLDKDKAAADE